jgi:hypothetical protein
MDSNCYVNCTESKMQTVSQMNKCRQQTSVKEQIDGCKQNLVYLREPSILIAGRSLTHLQGFLRSQEVWRHRYSENCSGDCYKFISAISLKQIHVRVLSHITRGSDSKVLPRLSRVSYIRHWKLILTANRTKPKCAGFPLFFYPLYSVKT